MTLGSLVRRFKGRVAATSALVLLEAVLGLLFPLFIGVAINGLLDDDLGGVLALGGLGAATLIVGSGRRFFDTRAYSAMYETIASEMVAAERERRTGTSTVAARTTLLTEFVEFLENSMPELVGAIIGTTGILVILAGLDVGVFLACLALLALLVGVYWGTSGRNLALNAGYNDELEHQVSTIETADLAGIGRHFRTLMRWNRRLSDLETVNYIAIWAGVIAVLVYAPIAVIEPGVTEYGFAFSTIMYVFQFVEGLVALPLFIQQAIRLREISGRLAPTPVPVTG